MTSQSRRKHRITPSSILRRTFDLAVRATASAVMPAGASLLLLGGVCAQESQPAATDKPQAVSADDGDFTTLLRRNAQAPKKVTPPVPRVAVAPKGTIGTALPPVSAPLVVPDENIARPLPVIEEFEQQGTALPPTTMPAQRTETKPVIDVTPPVAPATTADTATQNVPAVPPRPSRMGGMSWEEEQYNRRLAAVLNGTDGSLDEGVPEYWHEQSTQFQGNNRGLADSWHRESVQFQQNNRHVVAGAAQVIRKHSPTITTFEYADDVSDVYDHRSIITALGPVRSAGAIADEQTAEASRRLTRDMATIHPTLSYALKGIDDSQLPDEFFERMDNGEYVARSSAPTVLQWAPTNLWHHPLYFEDPALERYGHTYHPVVQPFASSGRFVTQLFGLPYQMALRPIHSRQYTLGYYRPGEYAPKLHYQIPFNQEAAMTQAAAIAGFLLIFP